MENENQPLVSIGLPIFNGEKELSVALDSLIGQDYTNLEIIISDNASTDGTSKICEEYVGKDDRIKYSRLEENIGAALNFNQVFERSSGKYFMWAAHDDQHKKSFVRECVEEMMRFPNAVACHAQTAQYIKKEEGEKMICLTHLDSFEGVTKLVERYRETLKHVAPDLMYGLFCSSAMRRTQMLKKILSYESVFIQELSIYGEFVQVRKTLFNYYAREKWNTIDQDCLTILGKKKPWWLLPFVVVFYNHWKRVACASISLSAKFRLWGILLEHETGQVALKILIKVAGRFCPSKWKERLGCAIFWRWMHCRNMSVGVEEIFLERIIKPRLGWWG